MAEYRINELAEASGVSVRNIRVYQDRGLLPPPTIRGRAGWYSDQHLVRLNLISRMLERGYTFATISELLHAAHHGMRVEQILRGSPKGGRFRNFKRAATITINELKKTLNASDRSIALSQKLGLLAKDGAHYAIQNPELLEGAEILVKSGVDLEFLLDRWVRVQGDLEDVAASFVSIITDTYFDENLPNLGEQGVSNMADLIQAVRPMAHEIVETTFRKALDEQISRAIGEAATYFDAATTGDDEPDTTAPDSTGDQSGPGYETTDIGTLNTETGR
ncbi:MerR family transcriptional regulator [Gordonia westfalica]|uniref:MerR HTH family regulatory protein n=1 Tax=Gordonia westfalica TaxID=158898 RepID=A0A1H2KA53_9ACTN|nr:MerR family transcriptional regulator [Gordonia westfalica]MDS1115438.1 MerR family transcriptional regulator [Gordonia westfalica]SDU65549.1 MerR HTH family regulatory protein [Gordonia westfalica]